MPILKRSGPPPDTKITHAASTGPQPPPGAASARPQPRAADSLRPVPPPHIHGVGDKEAAAVNCVIAGPLIAATTV
jgi:hypothetical protein